MPIVRLKPHDPRRGHRLRQLIDSSCEGKRYAEGLLYTVSVEEAEWLSWYMQDATRVAPTDVVHGLARAFDVFASAEEAADVLEEEVRGHLVPGAASANKVYVAPGRDAPEAPALAEGVIRAQDSNGVLREFRGPATRAVQEASPAPTRPPTALERRNAKMAEAASRKKGGSA